jgi:hypothetical protein
MANEKEVIDLVSSVTMAKVHVRRLPLCLSLLTSLSLSLSVSLCLPACLCLAPSLLPLSLSLSSLSLSLPLSSLCLQVEDTAKLSFEDQLKLIRNTNILIGIHGAGLMYIMFAADEAILIEIHPSYRQDRHFRHAARMTNKVRLSLASLSSASTSLSLRSTCLFEQHNGRPVRAALTMWSCRWKNSKRLSMALCESLVHLTMVSLSVAPPVPLAS